MKARFELDCRGLFRRKPEIIDDVSFGNVARFVFSCSSFHFRSEVWPGLVLTSPWQPLNHSCRSWPIFSRNSGVCESGSRSLPGTSPGTRLARPVLSTHKLGHQSRPSGGCSAAGILSAASSTPRPNPVERRRVSSESPRVHPLPTQPLLSPSPVSQNSQCASPKDSNHSELCILKYVY